MKNTLVRIGGILMAAVMLVVFGWALVFVCQSPGQSQKSLSLESSDGRPWDGDKKGWTFYVIDGTVERTLDVTDVGACAELSYDGQTLRARRVMSESIVQPSLRISVANDNIAVLMNGEILYSDWPNLTYEQLMTENQLSPPASDRYETINVALPWDYLNGELIVVQSTPPIPEIPGRLDATFCTITLESVNAYEAGLIASGFAWALPNFALYLLGAAFLAFFIMSIFRGQTNWETLLLSLCSLLMMARGLVDSDLSWYFQWSGTLFDFFSTRMFSIVSLMLFLAFQAPRGRAIGYDLCILVAADVVLSMLGVLPAGGFLAEQFLINLSFFSLIALMLMQIPALKKRGSFARPFLIAILPALAACMAINSANAWVQVQGGFSSAEPTWLLYRLQEAGFAAAAVATLTREAAAYRTRLIRRQITSERNALMFESYRLLRDQQEHTYKLRHEVKHHYYALRHMDDIEAVHGYLDKLIDGLQTVTALIHTQNERLDIILNGKLGALSQHGVRVEVKRMQAPPELPLSEEEYSSVFMNITDNVLRALEGVSPEKAYVGLDLSVKNNFFVFVCQNTFSARANKSPDQSPSEHGWGLQIVREIMSKHDGYIMTEQKDGVFTATIALPLK